MRHLIGLILGIALTAAMYFGAGFRLLLLNGTLAVAGMAMIVPMFLPSRWRTDRYDDDDSDVLEVPASTGLLS